MAGTIVADIIQSDQSYASSINIASPMVVSNTISMSGAGGSISGNVNFDSGTLFVDSVNNRIGVGGITNPSDPLHVVKSSGTTIGRFQHTTTNGGNIAIQTPSYEIAFGIDSSGGAYVNTGSANRLLIDSSGRVLKPYQPSFNAGFSVLPTSAGYLTHDLDTGTTYGRHNIGSAYSTSTGRFTAPVSGVYQFSIIHNMTYLNSGNYIVLRRNGNDMAGLDFSGISTFNGNYWFGRTVSCSVYLSQGDYIQPYLYGSAGGYTGETGTWGHFSGFLVG